MTHKPFMDLVREYGDACRNAGNRMYSEYNLEWQAEAGRRLERIHKALVENFAQMNGPPNRPPEH